MELVGNKQSIFELTREGLAEWCAAHGEAAYRADQIRRWLFSKRVTDFSEMHDVPVALRQALADEFVLFAGQTLDHRVASDRTEKLLIEFGDGSQVETVLMREPERRTVCISTQVGCAMGCVFCASGLLGVKRNLTKGEILEQILRLDRVLAADERITNIVVMGIGEPLANLSNLLPALQTVGEKGGLGLGARRITISTVGLPEKIRELAELGIQYNLAVSLHAPNEEMRNELVPVNKKIGLQNVLKAADEYFDITGRRVTYEYVMLGGVNDSPAHAKQLGALLKGRHAHVNLIPMNDVSELTFRAPDPEHVRRFVEILEAAGVVATVRKRKGADIDAACGQLRLHAERAREMSNA